MNMKMDQKKKQLSKLEKLNSDCNMTAGLEAKLTSQWGMTYTTLQHWH